MKRRIATVTGLVIWTVTAFIVAEVAVSLLFIGLKNIGVPVTSLSDATLETLLGVIVYIVAILLTIGVPWILRKHITTKEEMGLKRIISWGDIGLVVPAVVLYILLDAVLLTIASRIHGFNGSQPQDIGFSHLFQRYEYIIAFFSLAVIAPLAEEALFRGYLFGKIRKRAPFWVTMIIVSITFASLHIPGLDSSGHFQAQWNVAVDVFSLSLVLCALRELTQNIWAGVLLHAVKNSLAFYMLFIAPLLHL